MSSRRGGTNEDVVNPRKKDTEVAVVYPCIFSFDGGHAAKMMPISKNM